jgi:hypothetical protein
VRFSGLPGSTVRLRAAPSTLSSNQRTRRPRLRVSRGRSTGAPAWSLLQGLAWTTSHSIAVSSLSDIPPLPRSAGRRSPRDACVTSKPAHGPRTGWSAG